MTVQTRVTRRPFNLNELHPKARDVFGLLTHRLAEAHEVGGIRTLFRPFEGYRTPERQRFLLEIERTSKADAWQSSHQYGLAVDYVPWMDGHWSWHEAHDWDGLDTIVAQVGLLRPIRWDRPHIEHPIWRSISRQLV